MKKGFLFVLAALLLIVSSAYAQLNSANGSTLLLFLSDESDFVPAFGSDTFFALVI